MQEDFTQIIKRRGELSYSSSLCSPLSQSNTSCVQELILHAHPSPSDTCSLAAYMYLCVLHKKC